MKVLLSVHCKTCGVLLWLFIIFERAVANCLSIAKLMAEDGEGDTAGITAGLCKYDSGSIVQPFLNAHFRKRLCPRIFAQ